MDEKTQLSRFLAEFSLEDMRESSELKEISDSLNKYLKSRLDLLKHKETEMFKATLQLIELRSQVMQEAKLKSTQLAASTKHLNPLHQPEEENSLSSYFLEGMFNFDSKVESSEGAELQDYLSLQNEMPALKDLLPGSIPTLLFLRDSQGQHAHFILQYSDKNLALQKVYHYDAKEPAVLGDKLTEKEVTLLVSKMKQFLGDSYLGIKEIVLKDLEKLLEAMETMPKVEGTPNTFMGRSFLDNSSFLYS